MIWLKGDLDSKICLASGDSKRSVVTQAHAVLAEALEQLKVIDEVTQ